MKVLIVLLLLLISAGSFIPCCQEECTAESINGDSHSDEEEGTCSPLFSCAANPSFVVLTKMELILADGGLKQQHEPRFFYFNLPAFSKTLWQPPRSQS